MQFVKLAGHTISLKEIIRARRRKKRELQQIINRRQVLLSEIFEQRSLKKSNKETSSLKRYEND